MASVVFLRAANVGGTRVFRPKEVEVKLKKLGCVNVGAAGTFVIKERMADGALRTQFLKALPWHTEIMICAGSTLAKVVDSLPFGSTKVLARPFGSVTSAKPKKHPPLPWNEPDQRQWSMQVIGVAGTVVYGWWRGLPNGKKVDPNKLIEKQLGVSATTRFWTTFEKIREILRED